MRDIKKCGLTFPRELFKLLKDVLQETYPDYSHLFKYLDIYSNMFIYDEDGTTLL